MCIQFNAYKLYSKCRESQRKSFLPLYLVIIFLILRDTYNAASAKIVLNLSDSSHIYYFFFILKKKPNL